jgi:hypothetical protein
MHHIHSRLLRYLLGVQVFGQKNGIGAFVRAFNAIYLDLET